MLRLWATVLLANLVGTLIVALLAVHANLGTEEQLRASVEVASKVLEKTFAEAFMMGIPAGFIVALIVWLLPSARGQEFFVVIAFSYIIALGEFTHVVVDSAKVFLLGFADEEGGWRAIYGQLLPTLIGNIIGGTVLFSMLAYGQVRREIGGDRGQ